MDYEFYTQRSFLTIFFKSRLFPEFVTCFISTCYTLVIILKLEPILAFLHSNKPVTSLVLGGMALLSWFPIGALLLVTIGTFLVFIMSVVAIPGTLFLVTLGTVTLTVLVPAMFCVGVLLITWKIYLMYLGFLEAVRRLIHQLKITLYECLTAAVPGPVLELVNILPPAMEY